MRQFSMKSAGVMALAAALAATACASNKTETDFARQIEVQQNGGAVLSGAWSYGKEAEIKGLKLVAESDKLIAGGEKKVREGETLISNGRAEIAAQRAAYVEAVGAFGLATSPKQVKAEIKTLRTIAETWDNGHDKVARGEKLIKEGEKDLADGRSKKRKGDAKVAEGREQMRSVEARTAPTTEATTIETSLPQ